MAKKTYIHNLLVALDSFAAAVFFNRPDLTISSLCRVVQLADSRQDVWKWRVERVLKFAPWQTAALRWIGRALNSTFKNHCEAARLSDLTRAGSTLQLLDD